MKRIKIFKNNVFLDVVKSTLSLKYENNALNTDFKGNYSSFPFLILENEATKTALGPADITTINKQKTIDVVVFFAGEKFFGKLQVLSFISGFRKCNLKFYSKIIEITSLKISSFMPVVSVIPGETNPVPFSEEIEEYIEGSEYWETYPVPFISQSWPNVKWQFPSYAYKQTNQFNYDLSLFLINETIIQSNSIVALNRNHPNPHVYLLAPLFYALESIGYKLAGDFVEDAFIQHLLLHTKNDNTSETIAKHFLGNVTWNASAWETHPSFPGIEFKTVYFLIPYEGVFEIYVHLQDVVPYTLTGGLPLPPLQIDVDGVFYTSFENEISLPDDYTMIVKFSFEADSSLVGKFITFKWYTAVHRIPTHTISVNLKQEEIFHFMHPTIDLSRYVPNWTVGVYINKLKTLFNLSVSVDDVSQKVSLNFNEKLTLNELVEVVKSSHFISEFDINANEEFIFKYDNEEDDFISASNSNGIVLNKVTESEFAITYNSGFKYIPVAEEYIGALITEEIEEKAGVGLLIYDPINKPYNQLSYNGQTLSLVGNGGIFKSCWKNWTKARLNASKLQVDGYFTETELSKIMKASALYIDNQLFRVISIAYSETESLNYKITAEIETITY